MVLYLQWVESNGSIYNGQLLTTDKDGYNNSPATNSLQFNGVDNNGSLSFTASGSGYNLPFSGTANSDGTLTVNMPWSIFAGYALNGNTFSDTLQVGTVQDYNTDVSNMPTS